MTQNRTDRRAVLRAGLALGCSAAASPLLTPITWAAAPGDNRLVVIVLRGAMDGLDVVQPLGDPAYRELRPTLAPKPEQVQDLGGFYGLHKGLSGLMPLWQDGSLGFVHAVSTPYRNRRSHFDGQDFLENGGFEPSGMLTASRDGWLNRVIGLLPDSNPRTAFAVGHDQMKILDGEAPTSSWAPRARLSLSSQAEDLLRLIYRNDPAFEDAAQTAFAIAAEEAAATKGVRERKTGGRVLAEFAARQLVGEARVVAFSLGGWDTHRRQAATMPKAMENLSDAITGLRDGLGPELWKKTAIAAITEFGRTVRENGTRGTDHGTGGLMIYAGGAMRGGRIAGQWPGLGEGDLFENRDLRPTDDLRRYLAWMVRNHLNLDTADVERHVFPSLTLGSDPGLIG